jgi:succinate dehydrogenase / fumarate reductase flavoprotein subunit
MQGLGDGYFVIPYTIGNYLAREKFAPVPGDHADVRAAEAAGAERTQRLLSIRGKRTASSLHRELGKIMWEHCGMARDRKGLEKGMGMIPGLREEFWKNVLVPGSGAELNQSLELAGRVADFLELGELMCLDALERDESCGSHFRTEHQMPDGEAKRNDKDFCHVAAWEFTGDGRKPNRHVEPLTYENVELAVRSYK